VSGIDGLVERLHNQWANGQVVQVLTDLRRRVDSTRDISQKATFLALLGRFYAQSGYSKKAAEVFQSKELNGSYPLDLVTEFWSSISRAYFEYQIKRDFQFSKVLLQRAIQAGQHLPSHDIQVLVTSAHWRLSGIELSRNRMDLFREHQDIALSRAIDEKSSHEVGIVRLSRGYAWLAQDFPNRAYDEFLQGLYCVGYDGIPVPHFLHAELMLGLVLAQSRIRAHEPIMNDAVDEFTALLRIREAFSKGTSQFVTPYSKFRAIDPLVVSETLLKGSPSLRSKAQRIRRKSVRDLPDSTVRICLFCEGHVDLTIDHVMPRAWGGTEWIGNLRVLCRTCNSRRKDSFAYRDIDGYARLMRPILKSTAGGPR
jgi:hypothetical protein